MNAGCTAPGPVEGARPRRVLMTTDAVGGVWRYALTLAQALAERGVETVLAVLGPGPSTDQAREAQRVAGLELVALDAPLDWLASSEKQLDGVPGRLASLAARKGVDLIHLNLPSQAHGMRVDLPVVVVSHSCLVTWWHAVRGGELPPEWRSQFERNRGGFEAADLVLAPSRSHADMLEACYGPIERLQVVHNAVAGAAAARPKEAFALAAGRWWDEGKNAAVLDAAAASCAWPVRMAGSRRGPQGQTVEIRHAECLGELPNDQLRGLMARASVVVSPSRYEPFGLVALEGALAGAALVLSDIPTYRELWDGAALFADPGDPEAFAAAINSLATDEALRCCMAVRATERALRYSVAAQADAMLAAYAAVLGKPAKLALAG